LQRVFARILSVVVACLLFGGCATTTLESQTKVQAAGQGRIYFVRGDQFIAMGSAPSISVNGQPVGTIGNNSYLFVDREPGLYRINLETVMSFGQYAIEVPVRAGSTSYVEVAPRGGNITATAVGGMVGGLMESAAAGEGKGGPFSLALMDQAAGAALLQQIKK
jgi:hypothetical protein